MQQHLPAEAVALAAVLTGAPKVGATVKPKKRPAVVPDAAAAEDWGATQVAKRKSCDSHMD